MSNNTENLKKRSTAETSNAEIEGDEENHTAWVSFPMSTYITCTEKRKHHSGIKPRGQLPQGGHPSQGGHISKMA